MDDAAFQELLKNFKEKFQIDHKIDTRTINQKLNGKQVIALVKEVTDEDARGKAIKQLAKENHLGPMNEQEIVELIKTGTTSKARMKLLKAVKPCAVNLPHQPIIDSFQTPDEKEEAMKILGDNSKEKKKDKGKEHQEKETAKDRGKEKEKEKGSKEKEQPKKEEKEKPKKEEKEKEKPKKEEKEKEKPKKEEKEKKKDDKSEKKK